jgi:outer membrane murein-binding lipoprotein Lpp
MGLLDILKDPRTARIALYISTGSIILTFILLLVYLTQTSKNENLIKGAMGMISIGMVPIALLIIAGAGAGTAIAAKRTSDAVIEGKNRLVEYTNTKIDNINNKINEMKSNIEAKKNAAASAIQKSIQKIRLSADELRMVDEYNTLQEKMEQLILEKEQMEQLILEKEQIEQTIRLTPQGNRSADAPIFTSDNPSLNSEYW